PRQVGERFGRRLECDVDLGFRRAQVQKEALRLRLEPLEQPVGVMAVATLGGDPARGGVGMRQEAARLQLRELAAHRGGRDVQTRLLDERAGADRLTRRYVRLDDPAQDSALAVGELGVDHLVHAPLQGFYARISAVTPPPKKRPRGVSASTPASPPFNRPSRSSRSTARQSSALSSPASSRGSSSRRPSSTRSLLSTSRDSSSSSRGDCSPAASAARYAPRRGVVR